MKKLIIANFIAIAAVCFIGISALAQTKWTEKTAKEWFDKGEWRHGFKLQVYTGLNYVEFAGQYHRNQAMWDKALGFLSHTNLDTLSVGKHLIDGENVFATVTNANTKPYEQTTWESHRKYVDLHLMIHGKERIGVMNPTTATVTDPYDESKDLAHYAPGTKGNFFVADPETLMIFFPDNSHRPVIHVDGFDKVKKVVVKLRMAN